MNERIKELRKALGLTLDKFGERLGVGKAALSRIENGSNNVTDQMFKSICREFNVNGNWLRNGEGGMFIELSEDDEYSRAAASLSNDIFVRSLIVEYWKLDDDSKKLFRNFIHKLSDNMREKELFSDIPDTPEELEKQFPPVEPTNKHTAG